MLTEIKIPPAGESISSATIGEWHVKDGSQVKSGDILVTIETDKVTNDLEADDSGIIHIKVAEGEDVGIGTVIATLESVDITNNDKPQPIDEDSLNIEIIEVDEDGKSHSNEKEANNSFFKELSKENDTKPEDTEEASESHGFSSLKEVLKNNFPLEKKTNLPISIENKAPISNDADSEKDNSPKIFHKTDKAINQPEINEVNSKALDPTKSEKDSQEIIKNEATENPRTTRKRMSTLRRKIANHLVNAQNTSAILTTFNECDMSAIMDMRKKVQEDFVAKYGVKLGFMSFFIKSVVVALKAVPALNSQITGDYVIENNFYDIGVAVGTDKGLVVPVLRDCDKKSFAEIEKDIISYAQKARAGKIGFADLSGGVFTISNGGIYGSLLSTPIINSPQSGLLGMHTIQKRPVVLNDEIVIRPMMYLALSYDHRIIDGKEAVTFLINIKKNLETPIRLLLDI